MYGPKRPLPGVTFTRELPLRFLKLHIYLKMSLVKTISREKIEKNMSSFLFTVPNLIREKIYIYLPRTIVLSLIFLPIFFFIAVPLRSF